MKVSSQRNSDNPGVLCFFQGEKLFLFKLYSYLWHSPPLEQ